MLGIQLLDYGVPLVIGTSILVCMKLITVYWNAITIDF